MYTLALAALLAVGATAALAQAANTMAGGGGAMTNCATADASMMKMMHDMGGKAMDMKSSGDVDKDFKASAMAMSSEMAAMSKMEMSCGKAAKAKAAATMMMDLHMGFANYAWGL
jgi:hypothetical protein